MSSAHPFTRVCAIVPRMPDPEYRAYQPGPGRASYARKLVAEAPRDSLPMHVWEGSTLILCSTATEMAMLRCYLKEDHDWTSQPEIGAWATTAVLKDSDTPEGWLDQAHAVVEMRFGAAVPASVVEMNLSVLAARCYRREQRVSGNIVRASFSDFDWGPELPDLRAALAAPPGAVLATLQSLRAP